MSKHELANPELTGFEVHGITRGSFILRGALAAGAVYGTSAVAPFVSQALAETGGGDAEILNFALTLEYLEANFYEVKGRQVGLSGQAKAYATAFGDEEEQHVAALTAAIKQLGGTPVKKPTFVFPTASQGSFLALASVLENTGVGAYNGAAPSLQSKQVSLGLLQAGLDHPGGRSRPPAQRKRVPADQEVALPRGGARAGLWWIDRAAAHRGQNATTSERCRGRRPPEGASRRTLRDCV